MSGVSNSNDTFMIARRNMIEYQIRCCKVLDPDLLDMLASMPREDYVPEHVRSLAYMEGRVPLPCGQEMHSPLKEATIMQQLSFTGQDRVLEIGTGSGYLTNLLALRSGHVTSCDIHAELTRQAEKNLSDHGIDNVTLLNINAMDESAMQQCDSIQGPYDIIVIGTALEKIPAHLRSLLSESGQLISFTGKNPVLHLIHEAHANGACTSTTLFETLLQDAEGLPVKRELIF